MYRDSRVHIAMRGLLHKMKFAFYVALLNIILVPIVVHYWTCQVKLKPAEGSLDGSGATTGLAESTSSNLMSSGTPTLRNSCKPKKNIVFLKTHKTGSSTVTNILNRYGEANDLVFVLPRLGENRLDWPWFFQADSFYPLNGTVPNILCNHARFNKKAMEKVMPNDTIYVTILRDPVAQFESTFTYMALDKILGMENSSYPLERFFKDPENALVNYVLTQDLRINSDRLKLIRNGMFYDLGLESKDFDNFTKIREAIEQLDEQFHLVMMTEHFDESLVLLKRLMCWELDDMVYFKLNVRVQDWKETLNVPLQRKIRRWSRADVMLYDHFNRTFWNVLQRMGPDFWDEVKILRSKNFVMKDVCLSSETAGYSGLHQTAELRRVLLKKRIPFGAREMCKRMTWDEIKYLKYLRENFIAKLAYKSPNPSTDSILRRSIVWLQTILNI